MKIWTGKLTLNGERKKAGVNVEAKIVIGDSGSIMFEVREKDAKDWRTADAEEIHAESWQRALGETGQKVGGE